MIIKLIKREELLRIVIEASDIDFRKKVKSEIASRFFDWVYYD